MKTRKAFKVQVAIMIIIVIPVIAIAAITISSCGKTKTVESSLAEVTQLSPEVTSSNEIFINVDELPVFTGGDSALLDFITKNTIYPENAKKNNIEGKVIVKFVVEKDCSISNAEIVKSVDPLIDAEAVKVVSSLPKFEKPGKIAGKPVRTQYGIPITFNLK
jgi:periplasmic protein TonB